MRLYILSDNRVIQPRPKGLLAEWGFSCLLEINNEYILFDTGQKTAINNAILIKAPIYEVNSVVLSHGHYDHTTGLRDILSIINADVYMHPDAWLPRYVKGEQIGLPWKKEEVESMAKIVEHTEPVEILKNMWALGEIPREHNYVKLESYVLRDGEKLEDEILDDQSLAVKTSEGVVLILGCCHAGIRNTIEYAEEVAGDEVRYVVGGTHFIGMKEDSIRAECNWLNSKLDYIATCHCTGRKGESLLNFALKEKFHEIGAGVILNFE
jgi:7,8-dihydropterin-6-yl-methyl-4-(beta-D-ribofuranosyl)aminobenzene 5'-phosphate synthase